MTIVLLLVYALLAVGGLTCFKLGAQKELVLRVTSSLLSLSISWFSLLGMFMYVCSFLLYLGMVSKMELSYLTPVSSALVYILTMLVSYFVFREGFTAWKAAGIAFILVGVMLMNIGK